MNRKILEDIKIKKTRIFDEKPESIFINDKIILDDNSNENTSNTFKFSGMSTSNDIAREIKNELNFKKTLKESKLPFKEKSFKWKNYIYILLIISLGFIFYFASNLFEKAIVDITKKQQNFSLENKNFKSTMALDSLLPFEIMIISDSISEEIKLSDSKEVSLKAKGEITLFNEYSKQSEKITAGSYLSDESGKVYLTDKTIEIPGYTTDGDKIIPGKVNVGLTSFIPGRAYNGSPVDFTINSYKGTLKFNKIYGKAQSEFKGGASGLNYLLNESDKEVLNKKANSSLKDSLINKVDSLIPSDYIFYNDANSFTYSIDDNYLSETECSKIDINGTLSIIIFKKNDLRRSIIKKLIPDISDVEMESIEFHGLENLIFNFNNQTQDVSKELTEVDFSLSGELNFIWNPNIDLLRSSLIGVDKNTLNTIFKNDVAIDNAKVKLFPPWNKDLPLDSNKIKINVL